MDNPCDHCKCKLTWREADERAEKVRQAGTDDWTAEDEMCFHEMGTCHFCPVHFGECSRASECAECPQQPDCPLWS